MKVPCGDIHACPGDIGEIMSGTEPTVHFDFHLREILRGFSYAFIVRILGMGLSFVTGIWIARLLGPQGTGLLAMATTCVGFAAIIGRLGLDNALLRFVSEAAAAGDLAKAAGASRKGLIFATAASAAISFCLYVLAKQISIGIFNEPKLTFPLQLMALTIVPSTVCLLYGQLLQSLKKVGWSTFIRTCSVHLFRIVGLALIVVTGIATITVELTVVLAIGANILAAFAGWILWRRFAPDIRAAIPIFDSRELLGASLPLLWVASMNLLIGWTDVFMLGIYTDSRSVGIYSAASGTATLASLFLIAANTITSPKFAAFHATNDHDNLQRIAQFSARLTTLATLPVILAFLVIPAPILSIFGPDFQAGGMALSVLSVGQLVNIMSGSVVFLLVMTGRQKAVSRAITVAALANVVLNSLMIPPLGYLGACIATATSQSLINLGLVWVVWRELGIVSAVFPTRHATKPRTV